MAEPQSFKNHAMFDPLFHFFLAPVGVILLILSIMEAIKNPSWMTGIHVLVILWLFLLVFKTRLYALKVQDRVILLEERLRLAMVLPEAMRPRIPELSEGQLIALRFAPVAELPLIVESALKEKLPRKEIKKLVQSWQPDYWRV